MGIYINNKVILERQSAKETARAVAELAVNNAQKDLAIDQMAQTIARLNIELQALKGGA